MKKTGTFAVVAAVLISAGVWYWYQHRISIPASPIMVVLPAKVSGNADAAFLADAVSNTLSTQLEGISTIDVKAPPTSTEFEQIAANAKRASLAYEANLMVASGITSDGDRLRLEVQLLDPATENVLWRDAYEGSRSQYLETIQRAAEGLRRVVRSSSPALAALEVTGGPEAELAFREGEFYLDQFNSHRNLSDFDASFKALGRSLELNPNLANAAADIARLYAIRVEEQGQDSSMISEVQKWTKRALDVDPHCGRAYFVLASIDSSAGDSAGRLTNALRGATYAPDYAPAHLMLAATLRGSSTLGLAASRQARQTEPLFLYAPVAEAGYLHQLGRTSEAFAMLDRHVLSIDPRMSYGRLIEASLMIELGWLDRAEPIFKALDEHASEPGAMTPMSPEMRQRFAITQREFGIRGLDVARVVEMVNNPKATPLEVMVALEAVPTLANSGQIEDSFQVLQRAVQTNVVIPYDWLKLDRRLDRLRKDGRLGPIINRSRDQFDQLIRSLDEAKSRGEVPEYLLQPIADVRSQVGM